MKNKERMHTRCNKRFFFFLSYFLLHSINDRMESRVCISSYHFFQRRTKYVEKEKKKDKDEKTVNSINNQQTLLRQSFNDLIVNLTERMVVVRLSFLCKCDRYRICRLSLITYRIFNRNTLVCAMVVVGAQEFPGIESRCNIRQVPQKFPGESLFEHVNIAPSPLPHIPINYFTHPRFRLSAIIRYFERKKKKSTVEFKFFEYKFSLSLLQFFLNFYNNVILTASCLSLSFLLLLSRKEKRILKQ